MEAGHCVSSRNGNQSLGVIRLDNGNGNSVRRQKECLELCKNRSGASGCELIWNQLNNGCYAHTNSISHGNGAEHHLCWIFSQCYGL